MTVNEVLSKSPTGMAIRRYNDSFKQVITKDHRAFFITIVEGLATECPWPGEKDSWAMLNPGPTVELVRCAINGPKN